MKKRFLLAGFFCIAFVGFFCNEMRAAWLGTVGGTAPNVIERSVKQTTAYGNSILISASKPSETTMVIQEEKNSTVAPKDNPEKSTVAIPEKTDSPVVSTPYKESCLGIEVSKEIEPLKNVSGKECGQFEGQENDTSNFVCGSIYRDLTNKKDCCSEAKGEGWVDASIFLMNNENSCPNIKKWMDEYSTETKNDPNICDKVDSECNPIRERNGKNVRLLGLWVAEPQTEIDPCTKEVKTFNCRRFQEYKKDTAGKCSPIEKVEDIIECTQEVSIGGKVKYKKIEKPCSIKDGAQGYAVVCCVKKSACTPATTSPKISTTPATTSPNVTDIDRDIDDVTNPAMVTNPETVTCCEVIID